MWCGMRLGRDVFGREFDGSGDGWWCGKRPVDFPGIPGVGGIAGLQPTLVCPVDSCEFRRSIDVHALDFACRKIPTCICADVCKAIPFVHAKLANSHVHIQPVVVVEVNAVVDEVFVQHELVCIFAAFDFRDQPSPSFGEIAHATTYETFPPHVLLCICALWSFACADRDEHADFSSRPLILYSFIESLRCWVVFARSFVKES